MPVDEAVRLLIEESEANSQLQGPVFLGIMLDEPAFKRPQYQPILFQLPHKTRRSDETIVCLVVKDPCAPIAEALAKNKATEGLFDEVTGIKKLRRRVVGRKAGSAAKGADRFAKAFTAVFVQRDANKDLIECLGRNYYMHPRHIPIPVSIGALDSEESLRELRYAVKSALRGVQLVLKPEAKYASLRVGHTKMGVQKLTQNIEAAIDAVRRKTPGGLGHTAEFEIKTPDSLALKVT